MLSKKKKLRSLYKHTPKDERKIQNMDAFWWLSLDGEMTGSCTLLYTFIFSRFSTLTMYSVCNQNKCF